MTPYTVANDTSSDRRSLARRVRKSAFTPLETNGEEERSSGWVEFEDSESWELAPGSFLFGEYLMLSWRIDQIRVPASRVRSEVETWVRSYEEQQGRTPGRMAKAEAKETILRKLRRRVLPGSRTTDLSWNFESNQLWIWTTTESVLDEVTDVLENDLELKLHRLTPGARVQLAGLTAESIEPTESLWGADLASEVRRRV